jgi:hypothetical protein
VTLLASADEHGIPASQPEGGRKMPSASRQAVIARLSWSGLSPELRAIVGSAVAMTVASMFSMNSAQATIMAGSEHE